MVRRCPVLVLAMAAALLSGCSVNRVTYTEPAPEVYIIVLPTCTAWHVHDPREPTACEAPCCREAERLKPRWFE